MTDGPGRPEESQRPRREVGAIAALVLLCGWPVAMALVWLHDEWSTARQLVLTMALVVVAVLATVVVLSRASNGPDGPAPGPSAQ